MKITWMLRASRSLLACLLACGIYPTPAGSIVDTTSSGLPLRPDPPMPPDRTPPLPPPPPSPVPVPSDPQFYVALEGDDTNPGSVDRPWRTIQKAMSSATPGSTVSIRAGTYPERLRVTVSGTDGKPIVFQPNGYTGPGTGEAVVLDYSSIGLVKDGLPFLSIDGASHLRIQGLTFQNYQVRGAMQRGVWIHGKSLDVELRSNKFRSIQNNGAWDGTNALLNFWVEAPAQKVRIYGNEFGDIVSNYGEALTLSASDVTAEYNWFHDTDGIAIDLHSGSSNVVVRGNVLEWIGKKRDGTIWYNNLANAIYVDGGSNAIIERNVVRDSGWAFAVLSEPGNPPAHDVTVRNNIAYRNYACVQVGTWYSNVDGSSVYNVQILNNTLYQCVNGLVVRPYTSASVVWKNNIVANSSTAVVNALGWPYGAIDYNAYFGGGMGPDTHRITADPLFVNAGAGDFTLQTSSPAAGAGDATVSPDLVGALDFGGNPRVTNGRLDVGAYQR